MTYEFLELTEPTNNVARLTLRREAKKNALCMALRDEFVDAIHVLEANDAVHALVLAGGDGIFSAGFDLKEATEIGPDSFTHNFAEFFEACYLFPKPVVAAVDGPALAGGFDLALMGDFIIASNRSRFGHPEIEFGPVAVTPLARFVSPPRFCELAMLGDTLTVERAHELGIVYQIVEPEAVLPTATALAERLASKSAPGIQATKRVLIAWQAQSLIQADLGAIRNVTGG